jgi:hypothetical protein
MYVMCVKREIERERERKSERVIEIVCIKDILVFTCSYASEGGIPRARVSILIPHSSLDHLPSNDEPLPPGSSTLPAYATPSSSGTQHTHTRTHNDHTA